MQKERLEEWNSWWFTGSVPAELLHAYKRHLYEGLRDSLTKRSIISLTGLRRTGKTTLLYQLIQHLLTSGVEKTNILYFSFDDTPNTLESVLTFYREIQKKDFRAGKTYIFLDEIQKAQNWTNQLKKYYDLYPQIKFIISGSEALFIGNSVKETLAGRLETFLLKPLSFKEFLEIQHVSIQQSSAQLQIFFLQYIENGGFPELVGKQRAEMREYVRSIVLDKIIFKDIVTLFGIRDIETVKQLIEFIAANPGCYVDYCSLSQQFGKDRRSIKNYIFLLQESFLITLLGNYRKGVAASIRKIKRAYPVDSSFIFAFKSIIDDSFYGKIVESVVINNLNGNTFWKERYEIDLVLEEIPYEVKWQSTIIPKDYDGLRSFMKRFSVKKGILLTKNIEKEIFVPEGKILFIPVWKFLLEQ